MKRGKSFTRETSSAPYAAKVWGSIAKKSEKYIFTYHLQRSRPGTGRFAPRPPATDQIKQAPHPPASLLRRVPHPSFFCLGGCVDFRRRANTRRDTKFQSSLQPRLKSPPKQNRLGRG